MSVCWPLALEEHLNACAATDDGGRRHGTANPWGNSFPAEEIQFGEITALGGFDFRMPRPDLSGNDHVELAGQRLRLPPVVVVGVAALGYGEMGARRWRLWLEDDQGERYDAQLVAPGWLSEPGHRAEGSHLVCTHLHYPGDYELDRFLPTAWVMTTAMAPLEALYLRFSESPLVHLFAVSLLVEGAP